jgi:type I restriction enzyme R subunit
MFLAFTGTPLIAGEERTKEVFGDYVSIYDFQQSIEDGATVPLFYENRTPELQLVNPDLNEDIYRLIEDAELDADQEAKTGEGARAAIPPDHPRRPAGNRGAGYRAALPRAGNLANAVKAMVVSIDKATALRMHDKVKGHWAAETARVQKELGELHYQPHPAAA